MARTSGPRSVLIFVAATAVTAAMLLPATGADADPTDPASPSPSPSATANGPAGTPTPEPTTPARTASPTTGPTQNPTASPEPSASPSEEPSPPSTPESPSVPDTERTPDTERPDTERPETERVPDTERTPAADRAARTVSLKVKALDTPVKGSFFQDIGRYGFSGTVSPKKAGTTVEVWYVSSNGNWRRTRSTKTKSSGKWSISKDVTVAGKRRLRATLGGSPSKSSVVKSREVAVTVKNTYVSLDKPKSKINSLKSPKITGHVYPARRVTIHFQVRGGKGFATKDKVKTDSSGRFSFTFDTGVGNVRKYTLRARDWVDGSVLWETSQERTVRRVRVLDAKTRPTTAKDVAKTYRAGCPVGKSRLTTISMNYWGFDNRMHRGVLIVRKDKAKKVIRSFEEALDAGYPITRMDNPNKWNGNDPKMMAADNTSGFNCRKVVGNPYAQSPHSYGIAVDVNTVRNPYRDANGVWWPKNGRKYIDRTPWQRGMLTKSSYLTRSLTKRGFFWGGRWYPGRDYQHFEHNG